MQTDVTELNVRIVQELDEIDQLERQVKRRREKLLTLRAEVLALGEVLHKRLVL